MIRTDSSPWCKGKRHRSVTQPSLDADLWVFQLVPWDSHFLHSRLFFKCSGSFIEVNGGIHEQAHISSTDKLWVFSFDYFMCIHLNPWMTNIHVFINITTLWEHPTLKCCCFPKCFQLSLIYNEHTYLMYFTLWIIILPI